MAPFRLCAFVACLLVGTCAAAPAPQGRAGHPRLLVDAAVGRTALQALVARDPDAARRYAAIVARVRPYVERHRTDPAWIVSRLQMYWQAHSTQVFVKNGVYDHAEGRAPVPTVRFTGTRDASSSYFTPKLEDVKPYMGERDLLWLQNRDAPGHPWEWVSQAKSGRIVEAINLRIAGLARDAAFLYWATGDEDYARFAYDIFSTYLAGIAYREEPVDLNHGHDQTLVGLQSFEVIHEDIVVPLTETYDFMFGYVAAHAGGQRPLFDRALRRWADLIVKNGVPWNNWDLIQARFVLHIAAVLGPDASYDDGHGSGFYVRKVTGDGAARQWPLRRLLDHGYDPATGVWNESPGYSINVANDFMECVELLDEVFGIDVLPDLPALPRAARALPQYLLPNGRTVGFGDTRYETPRTGMIARLLAHARRHGQAADAADYSALLAALRGTGETGETGDRDPVHALLQASQAPAAASAPAAAVIADFQTPTFYAPNASWLVQRSNYAGPSADTDALAISIAGSSGNHAHANGIAMELYAKGLSLAPESGRGSGYLQNDHLEYYSQFPAHNTVVVDGVSAYPAMKSNHPFTLLAAYPAPGSPAAGAFPWATFGAAAFREPETDADQQRVLGIVRTGDAGSAGGYFIDIFRSRRRDGKDRYHDYIYHNLGQSLRFLDAAGQALATTPSERLSFADGDLIGYDYWHDRACLTSRAPLRARFDLQLSGRKRTMTAWLQGGAGREFFSVLAPPSTAWSAGMLPRDVERSPLPTLVIRQHGEAWARPFTAVFEPGDGGPARVLGVEQVGDGRALALRVRTKDGGRQTIMSGDADDAVFARDGQRLRGRYGIAAERDGALLYLFLGHGREIASSGFALAADADDVAAALWHQDGRWLFSASRPVRLQVPAAGWPDRLQVTAGGRALRVAARRRTVDGTPVLEYALPAMAAAPLR
ncbi:heparinase II/III domain-containing protein [Massilia rhizosphaerae]|uniref:heparinase II/III domain-containing protein n=1 Tax=Massilia rhizosphaerae TaxID=2784389 RepID=UPI0018DE1365|nr:heparinase II/III family protein [Massilia rhizosphaerae]